MDRFGTRFNLGFWGMVSGSDWFLGSGFWEVVSGEWFLGSGFWGGVCGEWFLASGFRRVVSGEWFLGSLTQHSHKPKPKETLRSKALSQTKRDPTGAKSQPKPKETLKM